MALATVYLNRYGLDFDDALVVACMSKNGLKSLISLDKDFDKVSAIKRIKL